MKIYDLFFYAFFSFFRMLSLDYPSHTYLRFSLSSIISLSALIVVNIALLFPEIPKAGILFLILLALNYILYFYKKRYIKVIKYFDNYKNQNVIFYGSVLVAIYFLVIIILCFVYLK
jgi:hypothetical protein